MSTGGDAGNTVAVECKRYGKDTELNERELLGEFVQATQSMPDLDIWALVTTRDVGSQLDEELRQFAGRSGVEYLAITAGDGAPSTLDTLGAQAEEIVADHLANAAAGISTDEINRVRESLEQSRAMPKFLERLESLQARLRSPSAGYANWQQAQNNWLAGCLESESESRAHFGQALGIGEGANDVVAREGLWGTLDTWFDNWNKTHPPFVVLGEEGDGKTWGTAAWAYRRIRESGDLPPVVFLPSRDVTSNNPHVLIQRSIFRTMRNLDEDSWGLRLDRWVSGSLNGPVLLLVLDGLNERQSSTWWRELLERLAGAPWATRVAILITCRSGYWDRHFRDLSYLQPVVYTIQAFNDEELTTALARRGTRRADFDAKLLPLLRKPRYLDLAARHRSRVAASGDITVERLIYEDWRDRYERKSTVQLDPESFRGVIRDLAEKYLLGEHAIKGAVIGQALPFSMEDKLAAFTELQTGGIFQEQNGRFVVERGLLPYGLGLLLFDQLLMDAAQGRDLGEAIAEWFEPYPDMDIKAEICEFAALHALSVEDVPETLRVALLAAWVGFHNPAAGAASNLIAYMPVDVPSYIRLAEIVWSEQGDNPWAQGVLMQGFLRWRHEPQVSALFAATFERWLGFVHLNGFTIQRGSEGENADQVRDEIEARAGRELEPGDFRFAGRSFTAIEDDGWMRLGRVALAIVSHLPRADFVRAIGTGCIAEALMGYPSKYELFAWVIRSSPDPVWAAIEGEALLLLAANNRVAAQAANRLLSFHGGDRACELQQTLPGDLFPEHELSRQHREDPCTSGFSWSEEESERCVQREDLEPDWIARQIRSYCINPQFPAPEQFGQRIAPLADTIDVDSVDIYLGRTLADHDLEQYEPALCAYAPVEIAELMRRIARQAATREQMQLRQLTFRLHEYSLLFGEEEKAAIEQGWRHVVGHKEPWENQNEDSERMLFETVLDGLPAEGQLASLLQRPDDALDLIRFERHFAVPTDWVYVWSKLEKAATSHERSRIMWFLAVNGGRVPHGSVEKYILPWMRDSESMIRKSVLSILYESRESQAIELFVNSGWTWSTDHNWQENHWGSLLLCEYGTALPFEELRARMHPSYLGYAVECRGSRDDEVAWYAEEIHAVWKRIGETGYDMPENSLSIEADVDVRSYGDISRLTRYSVADKPSEYGRVFIDAQRKWGGERGSEFLDLGSKVSTGSLRDWEDQQRRTALERARRIMEQQVQGGNHWFGREFREEALDRVVQVHGELVRQWLAAAEQEDQASRRRVRLGSTFYVALCGVLLRCSPKDGVELYRRLHRIGSLIRVVDGLSGIELMDYRLFATARSDECERLWMEKLAECKTDRDLMRLATLTWEQPSGEWLRKVAEASIESPSLYERARGITLLAFLPMERAGGLLDTLRKQAADTWIRELVLISNDRRRRNEWAQLWFRQFLSADAHETAWAAFRLFLHCVDSRYWFWTKRIQEEAVGGELFELRRSFLRDNVDTIRNRIKKNEQDLAATLFGQKVLQEQACPWM